MRIFLALLSTIIGLLVSCSVSNAQSLTPTTIEVDLDSRSRVAAVGASGSQLYNRTIRVTSGIASSWNVEFYGAHKYDQDSVQQATLEKDWGAQRLQAGIVRVPFGIYNYQETYASGLIDYPMPRGDYAYNSVDWGVPGVQFIGGSSKLQVEAAAFGGRAYGVWSNRSNIGGAAARVQTYTDNLVLGLSRWDGYSDTSFEPGNGNAVHLNGIDLRYTRPHLLMRGEYIQGDIAGSKMKGWYLDSYYRLPKYESWSLAARLESLKPDFDYTPSRQLTLGVRYVAAPDVVLALNWRRNNMNSSYGTSWTPYSGSRGDLFFQVYWKLHIK